MIYDVLHRERDGRLRTRVIADISEHVTSAKNSIFVACATIKTLETAARASEHLSKDIMHREKWRSLAQELRRNLPMDAERQIYRYADDADLPLEPAHLGMVYPFTFDTSSDLIKRTMDGIWHVYQAKKSEATSEQVLSYNWIWAASFLATICFYLGRPEQGYEVLQQTVRSVGAFMAPNEYYRSARGPFLPWFTTGAEAFVYAMNAMFVQVIDEKGAILFPAVPDNLCEASFTNLLATQGVTVSGKIKGGKAVSLIASTPIALVWRFRLPKQVFAQVKIAKGWKTSEPDSSGFVLCEGKLEKGNNELFKS